MNGKWPSLACPSSNSMTFWEHEWEKHGTCSESLLAQHDYFATALRLKESVDLLGALEQTGIRPDGGEYSLSSIQDAVQAATGYSAGIECNTDESGNGQLYQIYICVWIHLLLILFHALCCLRASVLHRSCFLRFSIRCARICRRTV